MEPDPRRERDTPSERPDWSPYDEAAAKEDAEWRRGRRRRWWATLGVAVLMLCVVGSVVGYILYDRATRIDRSTPVVVVFQYVDTIFTSRDIEQAKIFECEDANSREPLLALLREVEERERTFNVIFIVEATDFVTEELGKTARVKADIELVAPLDNGELSQLRQPWLFELRDEDGWRVCGAAKQEP